MLPSRGDQLVRRRIDVDGGRDPTDGTILCVASPWHSNVPSGKPRGGHRDVAIQLLFPLFHHRCLLMPRIWRPTIDRVSLPFLLLLLCFRPFAPWSLSNLGRGDCCVRRFIARLLILLCGVIYGCFCDLSCLYRDVSRNGIDLISI